MRLLRRIVRRQTFHPFRAAVIDDQRTWKGMHLLLGAFHLARAIEARSGAERIGVMLPTSGMFPLAALATWLLGRSVVPLNYLLSTEEIAYIVEDAGLDCVISVRPMLAHVGGLPASAPPLLLEETSFRGFPPLRRLPALPDDFIAVILYTSGTSGRPKGVMLSTENLCANIDQCVEWADFTAEDVMLGVLPQFHSFGLTVLTLLPLAVGCRVIYTARFAPRRLLQLMREHRPTAFIAIPSMYNALLHSKDASPEDFRSLRYAVSGGEPLPEAVFEGFRDRCGVVINEGYGLTETAPVTHWCRPAEHRRRSVGRSLPRVETRIVGTDEALLGPDEDGEVRLRGPNVMKGYFRLPELTASVFDREGFFRTGDMGRLDRDGHLFITGRIKEMLIVGGENVFPREIEEVLDQHAAVKASAVIGMQDGSRGEVPLAFVELVEGAAFDEAALRSHCRARLAGYKVPREIRVVEALPRNPTGKIMRRLLKA
ncbi:MAG TPA: AMP-binding protein [Phycisphaerales bacterium]|mgnify:CR=1 FL=1|nr:AMP-binding protein [Phycisphaerales bacterium]HMP37089.1 AMP-binding protein [Phycisphaerales bacterium]